MFELAEDEVECGMGVHGEAGYERIKLGTASELVALILQRICEVLSLTANDSVAVIVNNFGALSQLEQGIVIYEIVNQLRKLLPFFCTSHLKRGILLSSKGSNLKKK